MIAVTVTELAAFAGRHPLLSLALAGLTLALLWTELSRLTRGFKALRPAQLTDLLNRENALLVDLSPSGDFEKGHIAGARNIAAGQFDPEHKQLAKVRDSSVHRMASVRPASASDRNGWRPAKAASSARVTAIIPRPTGPAGRW